MIDIDEQVKTALLNDKELITLLGGKKVYKPNSPEAKDSYNCVLYQEISNVPAFSADNLETASRITYMFFVYSQKDLMKIANAIERLMCSIFFMRRSADPLDNLPNGVYGKKLIFTTTVTK